VYTATSGKAAIFKQLQVIANNLANMNTAGYKAERVLFEKSLASQGVVQGSVSKEIPEPSRLRTDEFVNARMSYVDLSQGAIDNTGNPLNAAIEGEGFFVIQTPDGERYTRSGEFSMDRDGRLVTHAGFSVLGQGGEITIPPGQSVSIQADGSVVADGRSVGALRVVRVPEESLIREARMSFSVAEGASVEDVAEVRVVPKAVEASNVNAVKELTDMIFASRLFEAMDKVQESSGRMTAARNSALGRMGG